MAHEPNRDNQGYCVSCGGACYEQALCDRCSQDAEPEEPPPHLCPCCEDAEVGGENELCKDCKDWHKVETWGELEPILLREEVARLKKLLAEKIDEVRVLRATLRDISDGLSELGAQIDKLKGRKK